MKPPYIRLFRYSVLCAAACISFPALANPIDGQIVRGNASIAISGKKLDVRQTSDRAVIDWRQFDIAPGEHTQFHQPRQESVTLNRVKDINPSHIMGKLSANGNVVVVNPNGIIFGKDAVVDVHGLVATTADMDNGAFMKGGVLRFTKPGLPWATVTNEGRITAKEAGLVGLVAPNVVNKGAITARLGKVHLASGDVSTIDLYGDGLIQLEIAPDTAQQLVHNNGTIQADGGVITLTTAAASHIVDSLIRVEGTLDAATEGAKQGNVTVQDARGNDGTVAVSGRIRAMGREAGEKGGNITVSADKVALERTAQLDASGHSGGGNIEIGGSFQGKGDTPTANLTWVEKGAVLRANARRMGKGGEVVVWADGATDFSGYIEARGGAVRGDGGTAEVSGKEWLGFKGLADLRAPHGETGKLLLDPTNLTITTSDSAPALNWDGTTFSDTIQNRASANLDVATLQAQLAISDVTVSTNSAHGNSGTLRVSTPIAWSSANSLTLESNSYMNIDANITYTGNSNVSLTLRSGDYIALNGADLAVDTGGGATGQMDVTLHADTDAVSGGGIRLQANADILTNGGDIVMGGGNGLPTAGYAIGNSSYNDGVAIVSNNILNAAGGDITIRGRGENNAATGSMYGVYLDNGSISTNGNGSISIYGEGGANGTNSLYGVRMLNNAVVQVENGSITMQGTGGNANTTSATQGVYLTSGAQIRSNAVSATSATINITGVAGNAVTSSQEGVRLENANTAVTSGYADITINGTGGSGAGSQGRGIQLHSGGKVISTGVGADAANIQMTGVGGNGANNYFEGILIQDQGLALTAGVSSVDGDITLTGTAGPNSSSKSGISLNTSSGTGASSAYVYATGSGNVTLEGIANPGTTGIVTSGAGVHSIGNAGGTGTVTLIGDIIDLFDNATVSSAGNIVIRPRTAGTTIGVGSATTAWSTLDLSETRLGKFSWGGILWIGGDNTWNNSGDMQVNTTFDFADRNVVFSSGSDINLAGTLTKATGAGTVNHTFRANQDIYNSNNAGVVANTGMVNLILNADYDQATTPGGDIDLWNAAITTRGGNVTMGGGIDPSTGYTNGTTNSGLKINGGTTVNAGGGNIIANGQSIVSDGLDDRRGIEFRGGSSFITSGSGSITMRGIGGAGGDYNNGVNIEDNGSTISAENGDITITGTAVLGSGANADIGVVVKSSASIISTGSGDIRIEAEGRNDGFLVTGGANTIGGASHTGGITILSNLFWIDSATIRTTGQVTLAEKTPGTTIGVGSGAGTLNIADSHLAQINAGSLLIGSATAGNLTIDSAHNFTVPVIFRTGGTANLEGRITVSAPATALQIVAGTAINNSYGANVFDLSGGGRFLTWSVTPAADTGEAFFGYTNTPHYNRTYGDVVSEAGSVRNYTAIPLLTVTPNPINTVSGQPNPPFTYTVSGWLVGDQVYDNISGSAIFGSNYTIGNAPGSSYTISRTSDTLVSELGYGFTFATVTGYVAAGNSGNNNGGNPTPSPTPTPPPAPVPNPRPVPSPSPARPTVAIPRSVEQVIAGTVHSGSDNRHPHFSMDETAERGGVASTQVGQNIHILYDNATGEEVATLDGVITFTPAAQEYFGLRDITGDYILPRGRRGVVRQKF